MVVAHSFFSFVVWALSFGVVWFCDSMARDLCIVFSEVVRSHLRGVVGLTMDRFISRHRKSKVCVIEKEVRVFVILLCACRHFWCTSAALATGFVSSRPSQPARLRVLPMKKFKEKSSFFFKEVWMGSLPRFFF